MVLVALATGNCCLFVKFLMEENFFVVVVLFASDHVIMRNWEAADSVTS